MESFVTNNITLRCLKCMITGRGSTNAGMEWTTGMIKFPGSTGLIAHVPGFEGPIGHSEA